LYVGKAKNLRNRLNSYKNAKPTVVSRKVIRLLKLAQSVELRICESETSALLTENRLLRQYKPPLNVVNTHPENYYFITLRELGDGKVCFRLTTNPNALIEEHKLKMFGVFKGRRRTRDSFQALLRLLSALEAKNESFSFPTSLTRRKTPYMYAATVPVELRKPLRDFLSGDSKTFILRLVDSLLNNVEIPKFIHHVISEDLKLLNEFYVFGPRRVRTLRRAYGIKRRVIKQDEIDDLLVLSSNGMESANP
jgi:excinuclease UvrABC nuclease subunit